MTIDRTGLYLISGDATSTSCEITEIWSIGKGEGQFNGDYHDLCSIQVAGEVYIAGFDGARQCCDIYKVNADGAGLVLVNTTILHENYDIICHLQVGGAWHIMAYGQESGRIDFYKINDDSGLVLQLSYRRTYGLVTQGFTSVVPYSYRGNMLLLGYNGDNGTAVVYQITVPAESSLAITDVWTKGWSPGWTRFAFFKLGDENFFLKSNPLHSNVNIDHMVDDPAKGSHPVGTHLPLPLDLDAVSAFDIGSDPYFITYRAEDGGVSLNRFHGNCQGWPEVTTASTVTGGSRLISFTLSGKNFFMIY